MNTNKRHAVIAGNWKMNKTPSEAKILINELIPVVKNAECDVVICVPFVDLAVAIEATRGTNIKVGAENCHFAESGAYTGEISASMLKEIGTEYVVIGHSERRQYFAETNETVNLRTKAVIAADMTAIVCVGEVLAERENNTTADVVTTQTKKALEGISKADLSKIIIAYEPVWAIGTGKTATDEQAAEVCGLIRNIVKELYDNDAAEALTVQYGGSMNPKNAAGLLSMEDIDGGLIGGASLKADDFAVIVEAAK
ncbi:MAG: triose-phosphate isomerase [Oscillospiraceae bacterium]